MNSIARLIWKPVCRSKEDHLNVISEACIVKHWHTLPGIVSKTTQSYVGKLQAAFLVGPQSTSKEVFPNCSDLSSLIEEMGGTIQNPVTI